jgi:hypothetical protein
MMTLNGSARVRPVNARPRLEELEVRNLLTGTWTALTTDLPDQSGGTGNMMLLSDGTVMVQSSGDLSNQNWYLLSPDKTGSYVNGTWSSLAPMNTKRLDYSSVVLPSGDVMVLGGEYSNPVSTPGLAKSFTNLTEIYDPVANTWTQTAPVPVSRPYDPTTGMRGWGDQPAEVLPDGTVLVPDGVNTSTYIYNPESNTWIEPDLNTNPPQYPGLVRLNGDTSYEENWAKLPDGSILAVPSLGTEVTTGQRFVPGATPAADAWVAAGSITSSGPLVLRSGGPNHVDPELGPAFLLPDGRVWCLGGNSSTALYTPSTDSWVQGPDIPDSLTGADVSGAMMPNGDVLFTASPFLSGPTSVFEFDPTANGGNGSITSVTGAPDGTEPAYATTMLMLPSGQVLFNLREQRKLWVYTPDGSPQAAWQPQVTSITRNSDGTYQLNGLQLNGISEGGAFGDNAEMSTNYPIVQLTDANGTVYFARTYNWSSTGVQTGSTPVSTQFALPANLPQDLFTLEVIASGIASPGVTFDLRPTVPVPTPTPINGFAFSPLNNVTVATFTDGTGSTPASDFSASIDWGDGSTSAGTVTLAGGVYNIAGSHTYSAKGTFAVVITLSDLNGVSTTIATTATIQGELLPDGTLGTPHQRFVAGLYRQLLGRGVDPIGLNNLVPALDSGALSPAQVVRAIETSGSEYHAHEVELLYQRYLNRDVDPTGLSNALTALAGGATLEEVAGGIVGSPEFLGLHGGDATQALDALYELALGRAIDSTGLGNARQALAAGGSLSDVALGVLSSHEYHADQVEGIYTHFLGRDADAAAANFVAALDAGLSDEAVLALILGNPSGEFFSRTSA